MRKNFLATAVIIAMVSNSLTAQDSTKSFTMSGSVDAYYRVGIGASGSDFLNNKTSFTNSNNTFQLGMASIRAGYAVGKGGVVVDLGFGKRAEEFSYADEGTLQAVKQAYFYYAPSDKVKFTVGKFVTHIGYELLDPQLNKNYSMSYMFTNGPFSHTGVKADFTLGGGSGLMIGITNPIDVTSASSGSDPKTLIAQYSKVAGKYSVFVNYAGYFGGKNFKPSASNLNQIGVTAAATLSDKFSLAYDGTIQFNKDENYGAVGKTKSKSKSWWGSALYANLTSTETFGLTLRAEYFGDEKYGIKVGTNVFATTLSGNIKAGGFTFIPELRLDNAKDKIFSKSSTGNASKSAFSAILAAVYSF